MPEEHRGLWTRIFQLPFRVKVAAIFGIVVVIAIVATLLSIFVLHFGQQKDSAASLGIPERPKVSSNGQTTSAQLAQYDSQVYTIAAQALEQSDTEKVAAIYQLVVNTETTTTRKVQLLLDEADMLYTRGHASDAIKIAQDADKLSDDKFLVADWFSRIYEDQKQYAQAAKYYTLAGKWASSSTNVKQFPKSYYDEQAARVTKLEGKS
jgi:tetratricopeptide (TPR) repeat protein